MGGQAVERHLARALRIYPGKTNLAAFSVGSQQDLYKFELSGSGANWDAELHNMTPLPSMLDFPVSDPIVPSQWIKMNGCQLVLLAVCPPEYCVKGEVEVHVHQKSSQREAVVEFSLDSNAAGAGCYAV
jgi:hypothetical protein